MLIDLNKIIMLLILIVKIIQQNLFLLKNKELTKTTISIHAKDWSIVTFVFVKNSKAKAIKIKNNAKF